MACNFIWATLALRKTLSEAACCAIQENVSNAETVLKGYHMWGHGHSCEAFKCLFTQGTLAYSIMAIIVNGYDFCTKWARLGNCNRLVMSLEGLFHFWGLPEKLQYSIFWTLLFRSMFIYRNEAVDRNALNQYRNKAWLWGWSVLHPTWGQGFFLRGSTTRVHRGDETVLASLLAVTISDGFQCLSCFEHFEMLNQTRSRAAPLYEPSHSHPHPSRPNTHSPPSPSDRSSVRIFRHLYILSPSILSHQGRGCQVGMQLMYLIYCCGFSLCIPTCPSLCICTYSI